MRTFPARQSSFASSLFPFSTKRSTLIRQMKRGMLIGVLVPVAVLLVIVAVSGRQITFIPNGTFFRNPNGASDTYSTTGEGVDRTGPFYKRSATNGPSCGS